METSKNAFETSRIAITDVAKVYSACGLDQLELFSSLQEKKEAQHKAMVYLDLVQKTNRQFNLMSFNAAQQVCQHLGDVWCAARFFADTFASVYRKNNRNKDGKTRRLNVVDVGSGGGFPVIPLALLFPQVGFIAIESKFKKINFLQLVKKELKLNNLQLQQQNIQEFFPTGKVDVVTARAFADLPKLLEQCKKTLPKNGFFLLFKGKKTTIDREIQQASRLLEGKLLEVLSLSPPFLDVERHLLRLHV